MAWLVGAGVTDLINAGVVTTAATWSAWVRFAFTAEDATLRRLLMVRNPSNGAMNAYLQTQTSGTNVLEIGFKYGGNFANQAEWISGFTAGAVHAVGLTYNGTVLSIYADTDATAKATSADANTPDTAGCELWIGNFSTAAQSADAKFYEVGWWPGTVLSGAQFAQLGAGDPSGIPLPTDYYGLIADAVDRFGGHNGVVTGGSFVAHSGTNLYAPAGTVGGWTTNVLLDEYMQALVMTDGTGFTPSLVTAGAPADDGPLLLLARAEN